MMQSLGKQLVLSFLTVQLFFFFFFAESELYLPILNKVEDSNER